MTWVQNLLDDENVFTTKSGTCRSSSLHPPFADQLLTSLRVSRSILLFFCPSTSSRETPTGRDFSQNFPSTVKHVYRQLLRVFAHLYHAHYPQILHLRSEGHFNSLFAHFLAFGREYELLDPKDIKGQPGAVVGVGALWEKWKEMGILESS